MPLSVSMRWKARMLIIDCAVSKCCSGLCQVDSLLIDLSDCTKEDDQVQSLTKIAKR